MTMFQSALYNAFFERIYSVGPNYLQNDYSAEDLFDLFCLAKLYLKSGYVGFGYNSYSNSDSCAEKLKYIETLVPPVHYEVDSNESDCPVSIYNYSVPAVLSEGDKYACFGEITASCEITNVSVDIVGNNRTDHYSSGDVRRTSYNIAEMDNQILINSLQSDTYHYIVKARTDSGEYILLDEEFNIIPEDGNMTINQYRVPRRIAKGSVFYVQGIIRSSSDLSEVRVEVLSKDGDWMTGDKDNSIGSTEYNIDALDNNTRFNILETGLYRYRVIGVNDKGTEVLVDQPFEVY